MCWNQGDWRFYFHYRRWQKRALSQARAICSEQSIDVIHQLNMVGFREPGFLWKISGPKFVWGPIGGMALTPVRYFWEASWQVRFHAVCKNALNALQRRFSIRVLRALLKADAVLCATPAEQSFVSRQTSNKVLWVSETGTDSPDGAVHPVIHAPLRIIWVGRFIPTKQLGLALRMMARLKGEDVMLRIVGSGPEREVTRYKALAESLGIGDQVAWLGQVPHDSVVGLMKESDLFLFTSIMEATSTVVMEALSNGLPVLCFDTCGFGPLVDENIGVKIPVTTPDDSIGRFADAVRQLTADPERLARMSEAAAEKAKDLTWDEKTAKVSALYLELTAS
ncbi:MAG: glycosyltransferase family 4 protein, partial [Bacteroidales bacterium]|nr:glycosyltransferase family 4 protein [Bacteroidales bacterium]